MTVLDTTSIWSRNEIKIHTEFTLRFLGVCPSASIHPSVHRPQFTSCNVTVMILPWLDAILTDRDDIALVLNEKHHFSLVKCIEESNGFETDGGFSCLFEPTPHVCIFRTNKVGSNKRNL